jgi:hypothetical protein
VHKEEQMIREKGKNKREGTMEKSVTSKAWKKNLSK